LNENNGSGSLESIINYYNAGQAFRKDTMNQQNESESALRGYSLRAVYTEPLWKRTLLELSSSKSNVRNTSYKTTYDYNKSTGEYDRINEALTNDFENTYGYTNVGLRIRTQRRNFNYSAGLTWQMAELEGKVISGVKDSIITQSFKNLLPNASFKYNFSRFKTFSLNYSTSTSQPTMSQLQPVPDLSNPLYIRRGNPDLKQEYTHTFRANFNLLSPYKNKNFFMFFNMRTTQNKIVDYDSVNGQTGIRTSIPVNINGVYNLMGDVSYSLPIRFLKGTVEVSSNVGYNRTKQFINGFVNDIRTLSMGPQLRFDLSPTDALNFGLSANYNYNRAKYSLESSADNNYLSQEYNASVDWQLPARLFLSTEFVYSINSQRAAGFNQKIPLWHASISKQILKFNRGEIKLSARDLLNRNLAITRTANQNYIEDKQVNSLRRFFLLSFTYSLSRNASNIDGGPGRGMRVMTR
jgi:outer membrane receptor protein involved in Fe transport